MSLSTMASPTTLSLGVFAFVVIFSVVRWIIVSRPPPGTKKMPGPWGLPFIGRVHDVDVMRPWVKMREFSDQFNGFYTTTIMGDVHLWVGDQQIAYDLLVKRAPIYSSRPEVPAIPGSDNGRQYLPLMEHGDPWKQQRKFVHQILTQGFNAKYYNYTATEVHRFLYKLLQDPGDYYELCDRYCSRICTRLAYGSPNAAMAIANNSREFLGQISPHGSPTNLMPFLAHVPEWLNTSKRQVRLRRAKEAELWIGLMNGVKKDMAAGKAPPCFARTFFEKQEKNPDAIFDEREAAYTVGMLSTVAILTVTGPLYTFLLAMVLHQDWQEAVRKEIDMVLGNRLAELSDSPFLPTLRAVLKECVRWKPPVPLGVPRLLEADDVYNGYFIPKGTIVHAVELALARDPKIYPDPDAFRPERWLDPAYPTYKEPLTEFPKLMGHHQFGFGRRTCPGIDVTEAELLTVCSSILWAFTLTPKKLPNGEEMPIDPEHISPNVIGGPLPFNFDCKVRDEKKAQQIMEMWAATEQAEANQM